MFIGLKGQNVHLSLGFLNASKIIYEQSYTLKIKIVLFISCYQRRAYERSQTKESNEIGTNGNGNGYGTGSGSGSSNLFINGNGNGNDYGNGNDNGNGYNADGTGDGDNAPYIDLAGNYITIK